MERMNAILAGEHVCRKTFRFEEAADETYFDGYWVGNAAGITRRDVRRLLHPAI
jgi:hypothetical protein